MKIQLVTKPFSDIKVDYIVYPIFEDGEKKTQILLADEFLKENDKFGKLYETEILFDPKQKLLLVGCGKKDKFDYQKLQNISGTVVKTLLTKGKSAAIFVPENLLGTKIIGVEPMAIGAELAVHDPATLYKSEKEKTTLITLMLAVERNSKEAQDELRKGMTLAESINQVRLLADMPANEMTPTYFLTLAKKIAKENRLKITVLDEKQAKLKGMGAFTGVAQGSEEPSYMIALEYIGNPKMKDKWGLIGKGITFDSGGISLKPSEGMHEMKYDMSGAAAVLGAIQVISTMKLRTNVVGVMAVTENLIGGKAQKPGDIVKTYSGKTAEVLNTDAEGRLVLIDAVAYAQKDFKATKIIDLATLTGAIVVALGEFYTGIMGNNQDLIKSVIGAGKRVGEKHWELPMDEDYDFMIKSDYADITNIGHGGTHRSSAGSITAAKFIGEGLTDDIPWVHLDIAGTAWDLKPRPYRGPGATGVGVKTLIELIESTN